MSPDKLDRYARAGLIGGLSIGLLTGFMISAPNFQVWPAGLALSVLIGGAVLGAIAGYTAIRIVVSVLVRGDTQSVEGSHVGDRFAHDLNREAHEHHGSPESHGEPGSYD